jgi:hypothetical protein
MRLDANFRTDQDADIIVAQLAARPIVTLCFVAMGRRFMRRGGCFTGTRRLHDCTTVA